MHSLSTPPLPKGTIPSETTPLGVGDWLADKDILCWLNQEVCHMELDEPCAWTLALLYIKTLSKHMERVESGTRLAKGCTSLCVPSIVVSGWSFSLFRFGNPLAPLILIHLFLLALKKFSLTTKHRALGFQTDGWSCGFQSLNIVKLVVEHRGPFSDVPLVPMGAGFVDYVLSIVNADPALRVVEAPGDDVEGVTELRGPPESPPQHPS